jgi:hypothetical protein
LDNRREQGQRNKDKGKRNKGRMEYWNTGIMEE